MTFLQIPMFNFWVEVIFASSPGKSVQGGGVREAVCQDVSSTTGPTLRQLAVPRPICSVDGQIYGTFMSTSASRNGRSSWRRWRRNSHETRWNNMIQLEQNISKKLPKLCQACHLVWSSVESYSETRTCPAQPPSVRIAIRQWHDSHEQLPKVAVSFGLRSPLPIRWGTCCRHPPRSSQTDLRVHLPWPEMPSSGNVMKSHYVLFGVVIFGNGRDRADTFWSENKCEFESPARGLQCICWRTAVSSHLYRQIEGKWAELGLRVKRKWTNTCCMIFYRSTGGKKKTSILFTMRIK